MHPELSSLSSSVGTLKARVGALTDGLHAERDAELLAVLYEVERSLGSAARQLDRAVKITRPGR